MATLAHHTQPLQACAERATVLVTTVDIGEGRSARIELREGDDPVSAARAFCLAYRLPEEIVTPLAQHITDNLIDQQNAEVGPRAAGAEEAALAQKRAGGAPGQAPTKAALPATSAGSGKIAAHRSSQQQAEDEEGDLRLPAYRPASANPGAAETYAGRPALSVNPTPDKWQGYGGGGGPAGMSGLDDDGVPVVPAHDRLYADHFRKQKRFEEERRLRDLELQLQTEQVHVTPVSAALASHRTATGYANFGERLYVEGRLEALRKQKLADRLREEAEESEVAELTFHPEISKMAQALKAAEARALPGPGALGAGGHRRQGSSGSVGGSDSWNRLYQRGLTAKGKDRMDSIRREQAEEEVRECSFRPAINARSDQLAAPRGKLLRENGLASYDALYSLAARRTALNEERALMPPEGATFAPAINEGSAVLRQLFKGRAGAGAPGQPAGVAERLLARGRQYDARLASAREALAAPRDAATGRALFCPATCRGPKFGRNPEGQPIGEYLYSIQAEIAGRAEEKVAATTGRVAAAAAATFTNAASEKIVGRLKRDRFLAIFAYLATRAAAADGGSSSSAGLDLVATVEDEEFMDTIDPEVRADVEFASRLYAAAAATPTTPGGGAVASARSQGTAVSPAAAASLVTAAQFGRLMEEVLQRSRGIARQYLLPMPSGRKKFEEPTFCPTIDPHSQALAAKMRREGVPAYEALYRTAEESAAKRGERRAALDAAALAGCSFRPTLQAAPAKEGRALRLARHLISSRGSKGPASEHEDVVDKAHDDDGASSSAEAEAAEPGPTTVEALERQIQAALMRLSLTGEQMAATLAGAGPAAQQGAQTAAPAEGAPGAGAPASTTRRSIDYSALFGSPTTAAASRAAASGLSLDAYHTPGEALAGLTPLPASVTGAVRVGGDVLAWSESGGDLVATILAAAGGAGPSDQGMLEPQELEGLGLAALAGAEIPVLSEGAGGGSGGPCGGTPASGVWPASATQAGGEPSPAFSAA